MAIKFTKGGILDSNQLESISGKKWKKGGILSATQLNKLSGSSEGNKKELVITLLENDGISISSNYKDVMREEDINNISVKLVDGSYEGMCHVLSKIYDSEYNETTIGFVSPDGWNFKYYRITADGAPSFDVVYNVFANVSVLANNTTPTVTIES